MHASHTDVHITPHLPFPTAGKLFQRNQTFWQWVQKTLAGQGVLMAQVQPTFWPIISLPRQAAPRRWMDLTLGQAGPSALEELRDSRHGKRFCGNESIGLLIWRSAASCPHMLYQQPYSLQLQLQCWRDSRWRQASEHMQKPRSFEPGSQWVLKNNVFPLSPIPPYSSLFSLHSPLTSAFVFDEIQQLLREWLNPLLAEHTAGHTKPSCHMKHTLKKLLRGSQLPRASLQTLVPLIQRRSLVILRKHKHRG